MAEDSKKVEYIDGVERLKEAVDELKRAVLDPVDRQDKDFYKRQLLTTDEPIGKVIARNVSDSVGRVMTEGLGYNCRCVMDAVGPLGTPRHSGRYPWKYDNIMIRKVLNMDSTRFNRFVSLLGAAGGNFEYEDAMDSEPMATIQIPANMLYHLHIDGDGSIKEPSKKIPGIANIQVFNDRAVQVTFIDGSQTKCVCGKDETFDLYEGIAFCLFKRFLGKDTGHKHFNDLMRYAFRKLDAQEESKKREAEIKAENKRHEEKKKLQAQRRKAKKREEKIGIFVEALKRNRQALINEMPVYSVPEPDVEFNKEPKEGQE